MKFKIVMRRVVGFFCILLTGSCVMTPKPAIFDSTGPTWPEAPEIERVAFVGQFSNARDLAIRENYWDALVSIVAGKKNFAQVRPMAVAVTPDGKIIFVADPDAGCVHRYDLRRNRYTCLTPAKGGPGIYAVGLAVTEDGHLFVADSVQGQLWQVAPRGNELEPFHVSEPLERPTGMFWSTSKQALMVTDTIKQVVLLFDRAGNLQRTIGERGILPGQFNFPTYVWMDVGDELLVTDSLNFRLQRFGREGKFLEIFGENGDLPGDFSRPKGVATDSFGNIYVIDALMHAIQIFNRQGELLLTLGEQGQKEGQFWLPNGIFITQDNLIFVADSYNKRVQVFRYIGPTT